MLDVKSILVPVFKVVDRVCRSVGKLPIPFLIAILGTSVVGGLVLRGSFLKERWKPRIEYVDNYLPVDPGETEFVFDDGGYLNEKWECRHMIYTSWSAKRFHVIIENFSEELQLLDENKTVEDVPYILQEGNLPDCRCIWLGFTVAMPNQTGTYEVDLSIRLYSRLFSREYKWKYILTADAFVPKPLSLPLASVSGKQVDQEENHPEGCELWQITWRETKQESFSSTAETYWVEAGANGEGTSENSPAGNITYILDTYNLTNSIVKVKPGTYNAQIERFPLTLNDTSVTLEATGSPSDTIIYGPGGIEEDYPLIKVAADEITIRRFTIKNYGTAILVTSSRNTIQGNYIANNKEGIGLVGSGNTVGDNTITNNTEIGVGIEGSSNMIIGNTITENNNGVSIGGSNNTVKGNTITNNKEGVSVGGSKNMIIGNTITENVRKGVDITGSNHIVKGNTIKSNNIGVSIDHSMNNLVKDNNISNNWGYGIFLEDTSNNTIEGNIITNNRKKGIKLSLNVDNTTIRNNTIRHNGVMGNIFNLLEGFPTLALATVGVGIAFFAAFIAFYLFKKKRGA